MALPRYEKRRQVIYEKLYKKGFLTPEARPLSRMPPGLPYMELMVITRAKLLAQAKKEGWSRARYIAVIHRKYKQKGWRKLNRKGEWVNDPWQMFRAYEDKYKSHHPNYESPWVKRQNRWQRFTSKFDRGLEKYEKGRYR